jgi:predicted Fe-S protein YdhL (DUF1289 family)
MTDQTPPAWHRPEIESPCVKTCVIHPETRLCIGCARTIDEIGHWSRMSPQDRNVVMADLPNRTPVPIIRPGRSDAHRSRSR